MERLLQLQHSLVAQTYMQQQRQKCTLDPLELKKAVYGPNYASRDRSLEFIKQHPAIFQHYHLTEASRQEQRQLTTRQFMFLKESFNDMNLFGTTNPNSFTLFGNGFTFFDFNLITKLGVHYSLYLKTIERLKTSKVHDQFYERACKFQDFGCFALTELMHGSNVKGMLTEAHYDHATRQLVLHTPSKQASKFWIGGAAKTSNISVVWAQLYVGGQCHGIHAIIVPLRDDRTHRVLPGITIGDCGPKFGLNGIDNGFIEFNRFRVPVSHLLDKVSGIDGEGRFFNTTPSEGKRFGATLAALSEGRLHICCHSCSHALAALTIAIRYCYVRRKFAQQKREQFLIEYPLTVRRMVPLLAQGVVQMCATMCAFFAAENSPQRDQLSTESPELQQIHAMSSGLKARTAWAGNDTIRECRQMMGGHGYSAYSKMGTLFSNHDVNNTWEGDNVVILQQTTKYVLENYQRSTSGKPILSPLLQFLQDPPEETLQVNEETLQDLEAIRKHFMASIARNCRELGGRMMLLRGEGKELGHIWNSVQPYFGQNLALQTCDLYILQLCLAKAQQIQHPRTKAVFLDLIRLWALAILRNDEAIDEQHHPLIEAQILNLSEALLPEVLAILESVSAGEEVLGSPFANEEGRGFDKYVQFVLGRPQQERVPYWQNMSAFLNRP